MNVKHTPGRWTVSDNHGKRYIEPVGDNQSVAIVTGGWPKGQFESNADLIAAAPCLLEALQNVVAEWDALYPSFPKDIHIENAEFSGFQMARAAIARATGETK